MFYDLRLKPQLLNASGFTFAATVAIGFMFLVNSFWRYGVVAQLADNSNSRDLWFKSKHLQKNK